MTTVDPFRAAAAVVTRGDGVDAWHDAAVAVVDGDGRVTHALGDPELVTFTRSAIKPLQALPLCLTGACDALAIDDEELALAAASHDGGDVQRDVAARLLAKAGAGVEQLQLRRALADRNARRRAAIRAPARIAIRCATTARESTPASSRVARTLGVPPERYLDPDAAVQRAVKRAVADACEVDEASLRRRHRRLQRAELRAAARRRWRAASRTWRRAVRRGAPLDAALARVRAAMQAHPQLVSGADALRLRARARVRAARVVCKGGAEALQAIGFSDPPLGIAVKVLDGGDRALAPIVHGGARASSGSLDDERAGRPRPPRAPDGHEPPRHRDGRDRRDGSTLADCPLTAAA